MRVKRLQLKDFRNYLEEEVDFAPGRNIIIGENAQGKTNLLEALEYVSTGRSCRTSVDAELIRSGAPSCRIHTSFEAAGNSNDVSVTLARRGAGGLQKNRALEKTVVINGVTYKSTRNLRGRLTTVSFKSDDLNLLRGGPKDRRDWIDDLTSVLKGGFARLVSRYGKVVTQRNRLLKQIFESDARMRQDIDQLAVWDTQVAELGASIVKLRLAVLQSVLPLAEERHARISGSRERFGVQYFFRIKEPDAPSTEPPPEDFGFDADEKEIERRLMAQLVSRRQEEIARRQTLTGPHRDDVRLAIDGASATAFASQGQQRSLVISLKLAELDLVTDFLDEPPVLLLDDVLAELDLKRQGFLLSLVDEAVSDQTMQTVITATHVDGFEPQWLESASFIRVQAGRVQSGSTSIPL